MTRESKGPQAEQMRKGRWLKDPQEQRAGSGCSPFRFRPVTDCWPQWPPQLLSLCWALDSSQAVTRERLLQAAWAQALSECEPAAPRVFAPSVRSSEAAWPGHYWSLLESLLLPHGLASLHLASGEAGAWGGQENTSPNVLQSVGVVP